jgi:polyisoprenoid-binding protein YceI
MKGHLHSAMWLDVAKFPEMTFETAKVENVKTTGNETTADISGTMTIKGVAKQITIPVKITYLKDALKDRVPNLQGDLLVLRANFSVKRKDYGINAGQNEDKVSDTIQLSLSIAGQAPR